MAGPWVGESLPHLLECGLPMQPPSLPPSHSSTSSSSSTSSGCLPQSCGRPMLAGVTHGSNTGEPCPPHGVGFRVHFFKESQKPYFKGRIQLLPLAGPTHCPTPGPGLPSSDGSCPARSRLAGLCEHQTNPDLPSKSRLQESRGPVGSGWPQEGSTFTEARRMGWGMPAEGPAGAKGPKPGNSRTKEP